MSKRSAGRFDSIKTDLHLISLILLGLWLATGLPASSFAQEIDIPDPGLDAAVRAALQKPGGALTESDLLSLTNLNAISRSITNLAGLGAARNLTTLLVDDNHLSDSSFTNELANLSNLAVLDLSENPFTILALPTGFSNLTYLRIEAGHLTTISFPAGLTKLTKLLLGFNQLANLPLRTDMTNLNVLSAFNNQITNFALSPNLKNLSELDLDGNHLSSLLLPSGLTNLSALTVGANELTSFAVPADMTNLAFLRLNNNQLTNLTLPAGLGHLSLLHLTDNQLSSLVLPAGLTNLSVLNLAGNQLTNITLPPDATQLTSIAYLLNPLVSVVLSEVQATNLAVDVAFWEEHGIPTFIYPLTVQLLRSRSLTGAFQFGIAGPPGSYVVLSSTNLSEWSQIGIASNDVGAISFVDTNAQLFAQRFYRALKAPANMVFIPPNTFTMGSPTNEQDRDPNEGPQTTVTLTHGYWIGKYEVTEAEYLDVMGTNPSAFPGDLRRPISSVSWPDATNYCWLLTQREIAAGRIPPGSRYRLPTEAEWEYAARAGTTTRFSYGDDPDYSSLTNYAWQNFEDGLTVHPVGRKLPNPWGLYDMAGNVFEWCQDWLGPLPGGSVTDPQGPATNPIGWKVMRGGAFDFGGPACRSASRNFFGNHPALSDWNLGIRVVLVLGNQ